MLIGVFSLILLLSSLCQGRTLFVISSDAVEFQRVVEVYSTFDEVDVINLERSIIAAKRALRTIRINGDRYSCFVFLGSLSENVFFACRDLISEKKVVVALSIGDPEKEPFPLFPTPKFMYKVIKNSRIVVVAFPEVLREVAFSYQRFFSKMGLRVVLFPVEGIDDMKRAIELCKGKRRPSLVVLPFSSLYTYSIKSLLKKAGKRIRVIGFGDGPYTVKVMVDPRALGKAIAMYFKGKPVEKDSYFYLVW